MEQNKQESKSFIYNCFIVYVKSQFDLEKQVIPFIKATAKSVFKEEITGPDSFEPQPYDPSKKLYGSLLKFSIYSKNEIEEKKQKEFQESLLKAKAYETEDGEDANNCPVKTFYEIKKESFSNFKKSIIQEKKQPFLNSSDPKIKYQLYIEFCKNRVQGVENNNFNQFFREEIEALDLFEENFLFDNQNPSQVKTISFGSSISFDLKVKDDNKKSNDELLIVIKNLKAQLKSQFKSCLKNDFKQKDYEPIKFNEYEKKQ
ncbi:hypothetical protein PPERSA_05547 [Pseudocohnilembus persalinus]|uniref:Uncharacterized protein n=1 Tax=Pseudocohnilembus persalinus TaxID=266149 RepID=A0A0V0QT26_PSEPJ|nr:hypothetical protein PPERSA_05547 [Pseudocohnilembus persalinus]|eukprot:KRX05438.1 hypothetical protein PPERSA_05547 [Pseudocohnilembus persalinus]